MQDLEIAKKRLSEKSLVLSIVKRGGIILETASNGISGFLGAIGKFGNRLEGSSVADKIVGKAIALLCVYAKVEAVYAKILSKEAEKVFEKYKIYHEWDVMVENILNVSKVEKCPFEKLAAEISDPKDAYKKLKLYKSL